MHWTEPVSAAASHAELENRLCDAVIKLGADTALKPPEFSAVSLGLIFLRHGDRWERGQHIHASLKPEGPAACHVSGHVFHLEALPHEN